jgi:TPR repeat protein
MYSRGSGLPQDDTDAAKWIGRAAEQGDADGQKFLGMLYAMGHGVPKDYVIAYMWLNLAAARGKKEAAESRDVIARLMTPEQIGEGHKLAASGSRRPRRSSQHRKNTRKWPKNNGRMPLIRYFKSTPKNQWQIACSLTKTTTIKPRVLHEKRRGCMRYLQFARKPSFMLIVTHRGYAPSITASKIN